MDKYWRVCSKAVCAGRNYVAHAAELNNPLPSAPFFFLKPTSSFLPFNDTPLGGISKTPNAIEYPKENELHHELELMVVISTPLLFKPIVVFFQTLMVHLDYYPI